MGDDRRTKLGPGAVSFEYHLTSKRVVLTYPHPCPCTVIHLVEKTETHAPIDIMLPLISRFNPIG